MSLRRIIPLSTALLLGQAAPSLADVPPPPGYEEKCTVDLKEQEGTTCKTCSNGPGDGGDLDRCKKEFTGTAFTYVCQTRGASFWTEVWCDGPPREDSGCSIAQPGASTPAPTAFAYAFAGLAVMALRRRRR